MLGRCWWTGKRWRTRNVRETFSGRTAPSSTPTTRTSVPCAPRSERTWVARQTPSPPSVRADTLRRQRRTAKKVRRQAGVSRKTGRVGDGGSSTGREIERREGGVGGNGHRDAGGHREPVGREQGGGALRPGGPSLPLQPFWARPRGGQLRGWQHLHQVQRARPRRARGGRTLGQGLRE